MADTALVTGVSAAILAVAQTVSGVFRLGDLKQKVAAIVDKDLPALRDEIAAIKERVDALRSSARRASTASQPSTNIVGEIQVLRDRVTSTEHKLDELGRRLDDQREAFAEHKAASDEAWHDMEIQIREIVVAVLGKDALGVRSGRRG